MANSIQLVGRVLNDFGDAISGATVVAVSNHAFQRHPIEAELWEGNGLSDRAQVTQTDNEGRFEFHDNLIPGQVLSVSVLAEGYAPLRHTHERLSRVMPHDMGDLMMKKGHSISGTVVDVWGAPLPHVRVLMAMERGVPGNCQSFPGRGIPLTQTDSQGRFTATGLLPGRWYLLFDKDGYRVIEQQGNFFNEPHPEELFVTLDHGTSISGRVLNVPTEHVDRLMVEARPIRRSVDYIKQFPSRGRPRRAQVQTDGSFRIDGISEAPFEPNIQPFVLQGYHSQITTKQGPPEVWLVVGLVTAPNQRLIELPEVQSCRVELSPARDSSKTDVDLPWLGRVDFSARAVNRSDEPVEVQSVEVRYESGFGLDRDEQHADLLPDGRIELRDYGAWDSHLHYWTPARKVYLWIRAVGYEFLEIEIQDYLRRGQYTDFGDITLKETPSINVRVVDSAGNAISQAKLRLSQLNKGWIDQLTTWAFEDIERKPASREWNFQYHCLVAISNERGEAVLSQVVKESEMLCVSHPDYAFQVHAIEAPTDDGNHTRKSYPAEIQLASAGRIMLTVLKENGQPAAWRPVVVKALIAADSSSSKNSEMRDYCFEAETDENGIAIFERLHGRFLVALQHPERNRRPESRVLDGEQTIVEVAGDDVEVTLTAWPLCDFSVTVRESDRPIVGGSLQMMSEYLCTPDASYKHLPFKGYTGDRGHYRFRDVPRRRLLAASESR